MAYKWDGISDSEKTVKAEDIMDGIQAAEDFINKGIGRSSFKNSPSVALDAHGNDAVTGYSRPGHTTDGYIDQRHIFKPDFYGSPAPRMEAVSSQVHYRSTDHSFGKAIIFSPSTTGEAWEVIPGTACRIKLRDHATVIFTCSFFCFELGGVHLPKSYPGREGGAGTKEYPSYGGQTRRAGRVALSIRGKDGLVATNLGSTTREIYTSSIAPFGSNVGGSDSAIQNQSLILMTMQGRQQHSIMKKTTLPPGVYDIGLVFKARQKTDGIYSFARSIQEGDLNDPVTGEIDGGRIPSVKHIIFRSRNMVCDVMYTKRAKASEELEPWRTMNDKDPQAI